MITIQHCQQCESQLELCTFFNDRLEKNEHDHSPFFTQELHHF